MTPRHTRLNCHWSTPVEFRVGPKAHEIRVKRSAPMRTRRFIRVLGEIDHRTNMADGPVFPPVRESANARPDSVPPGDPAIVPQCREWMQFRVSLVMQMDSRFDGRERRTCLKRSALR